MLLNENLIKLIPDKKLRNKLRSSFQYKIFNEKKSKKFSTKKNQKKKSL